MPVPRYPAGYTGNTPLVQSAALDLTLILLENALCRWAPEDLIFFEPAGSILPAAP
jgi:urease accessory protein UreH